MTTTTATQNEIFQIMIEQAQFIAELIIHPVIIAILGLIFAFAIKNYYQMKKNGDEN